jgi:hypothetical protein
MIGRVDGLVASQEEVRKLMQDRTAWRSRINMIVAANQRVDSSRREDCEIRRGKTKSAIISSRLFCRAGLTALYSLTSDPSY